MNAVDAAMQLPEVSSYGHYASSNYGLNTLMVTVGGLRLYYSYRTIVAYYDYQDGLVVCQNTWDTTTGKHLNWIDGGGAARKDRLLYGEFLNKLYAAIARHVV